MKFDDQADIYDQRTGLGNKTAQRIASSLQQLIAPYSEGQFLEVGAGTGEIGYFLQNLPRPYVGIDLSAGMLEVYKKRFKAEAVQPQLIQADGNTRWPLADNSVSVFFSSRAMHQLNHEHVLQELERLAAPSGAILILGNVKRDKQSVKAIMRKEMHALLHTLGMQEKSGQSNRNTLFAALEQQGGIRQKPLTASHWQVSHAPIDSLQSWASVDGIAGQAVTAKQKEQLLAILRSKAETLFTDLHQALESQESYELNAITLPYH